MHLLSSIILAFAASLDSLIIGLAYGIKNIKIRFTINFVIAIITSTATFCSMYFGLIISKIIPTLYCNYIGAGLLLVLGLWMLYDCYKKEKSYIDENTLMESLDYDEIILHDKTADIDHSGDIDIKEALTLSLALSINNLGLGIGASITGISLPLTTLCTFIFSILTLLLGLKIGNSYFAKLFGKYAPLLSAIIIILMGLFEMFI